MLQKFKKITAIFLSLVILTGTFSSLMIHASYENADLEKGEFIFAPHTYTEGDLSDIYYYTDDVFSGSALDYNEHLATMSMILAAASISSQEPDAAYEVKSSNLSHLLREWDFGEFAVNEYYTQRPGEQTMGVGMAYKVIGEGDDAYTLLAIVPRSAGYQKEWAGNFTVGTDGVHEGFATGRDIILEFANQYVEENKDGFKGLVKVWTVGYSRGAGVANLLAAYLDDNSNALGIEVTKENIFAYTFGTPSNVQYADEAEKAALESNYLNIHNRYSEYDIVTYAPFKNWNFTFYGTTKLFDVYNAEKKAEMLSFLEKTNKTIYDIYTAPNSSADPDNFTPLMLQVDISLSGLSAKLVPADPAYGIPTNQKDFLEERIAFLVENLVPDRETYVNGGYQYALQRLTSLYFGLDAEQGALLFQGMSHNVKILAALYYCYYISECYLDAGEDALIAMSALNESIPILEEYVQAAAEMEEYRTAEWYQYVCAFMASEEYAEMKEALQGIASDMETYVQKVAMITSTIKNFAVGMTAKVLGGGVSALTLDEEEKAELMETMTSEEVTVPLTEFLVYLLLGSDDGIVSPFDPSNKNISLAITFLSNAGRYMRVHNNEIILSWLRTEDSYYANEDWHIHDIDFSYDETGHWGQCECGYTENFKHHTLSDWETIYVEGAEKEELVRGCACGYEEIQEVFKTDDQNTNDHVGFLANENGMMTFVFIGVGAALVIAAAAAMIVISKKRKVGNNGVK